MESYGGSWQLLPVYLMPPHFQSSSGPKFVQFTYSTAIAAGTFDQGSVYLVAYPPPSCSLHQFPSVLSPCGLLSKLVLVLD